ncbi:hypothetical protein GCM10009609_47320 [Pseudonocardia aurantiaca]
MDELDVAGGGLAWDVLLHTLVFHVPPDDQTPTVAATVAVARSPDVIDRPSAADGRSGGNGRRAGTGRDVWDSNRCTDRDRVLALRAAEP